MIIKKNTLREETANYHNTTKALDQRLESHELLGMMTVKDQKVKVDDKESQRVDPMAAYISNFEKCANTFRTQMNMELDEEEKPIDITKTIPYIFGQILVEKTND